MRQRHIWTDTEREIVRRDYDGHNSSARRIANNLGVTFCAVKGQAAQMGILQDKSPDWTEKEVKILTEMISNHPPLTIARRLHRSVNAVVVKSKRLGLLRRYRDGWYTMKEVCEILGIDHHKATRWIETGELKASYHHGHKPQKNGSGYWHIDKLDLRSFIIHHASQLGRNHDLFQIIEILAGIE